MGRREMTKPTAEQTFRTRPLLTPYAILWSMFGMLGLAYLGVAIFAPDLLDEISPQSRNAERQRVEAEATMLQLSTDVNGIRSGYGQVQLDLAKVQRDIVAGADASKQLDTRITALEDEVRQLRAPSQPGASAPPAKVSANETSDGPKDRAAKETASPQEAKAAAASPIIINGDLGDGSSIETGSVDTKPEGDKHGKSAAASADTQDSKDSKKSADSVISFGPAVVKPAAKPVGIRVASGTSVDGLKLSWSLLSEHHELLRNLKPRYVDSGDAVNPSFDLLAGPIKTKADAQRRCKKLTANNVPCTVGEFKGVAL
jgi:hypothetical protein